MKVVPWDGPADDAGSMEPEVGGGRVNAMRSWLVSGVHLFVVDPRRRFGSHVRTRELLVVERPASHEASERWQTLAAALHRHTVRDGLARLSAKERRIITLAYLEGHTNREIAAMLGVSVSTVRRRLWVALEHLDTYLRRSGAWLAALLLGALAYANAQAARTGRWAGSGPVTERAQLVAAAVAVGAIGAAAAGLVVLSGPTVHGAQSPVEIKPPVAHVTALLPTFTGGPSAMGGSLQPIGLAAGLTATGSAVHKVSLVSSNGCHGNPTSSPPTMPVGSPGHHPLGAPVTHPSAGGCIAA
jgi:sigma-70-like protein